LPMGNGKPASNGTKAKPRAEYTDEEEAGLTWKQVKDLANGNGDKDAKKALRTLAAKVNVGALARPRRAALWGPIRRVGVKHFSAHRRGASLKALVSIVAVVALTAVLAPAASAVPNWRYCKTSATGWRIWENANNPQAGCPLARGLYRKIKRYQGSLPGGRIPPDHAFTIRMSRFRIVEYCRSSDTGYRVRCRDKRRPSVDFRHP
jgi:hypothetical protein